MTGDLVMGFLRKRRFIILAVIGAGFLAFVLLRYVPLQRCRAAVKQAQLSGQLDLARRQAESAQLPELREQIEKLGAKVGGFEVKVPSARNYGSFLEQVTELMDSYRLKGQSVQPGSETEIFVKDQKVMCIPISIKCSGKLKDIFEFFQSLQVLDRKIRIGRVELGNSNKLNKEPAAREPEVSLDMQICIYYMAP